MRVELNYNSNDNNKYCKNVFFYNFNTFPILINTQIFNHTYFSTSFGVVRIEIGNKLKVKIGFFKCM